jgi:imidazolonepropionase-like amidohydrolase
MAGRARRPAARPPVRPVHLLTPRGLACRGLVLAGFGPGAATYADGVVLVGTDGAVVAVGPADRVDVPADVPTVGGPGAAVVPGLVDAHVHLAFSSPAAMVAGGVVAVRDLGAPLADARRWRAGAAPVVAVAGPVLTAPGGYPSRTWGAAGFAEPVADAAGAKAAVRRLAAAGVDLVKLALEPAGGAPVPSPAVAAAVVAAAHDAGLAVTCHALTAAMVGRALDAGVDELCHTPVETLPAAIVERVAGSGVGVVSTLHTLAAGPGGGGALANARALVAAGVPMAYGSDLGNAGTRPGADPRELARLARAGLGAVGALRAATEEAGGRPGLAGRVPARICPGQSACLLVLAGDPRRNLAVVAEPVAVVLGAQVVRRLSPDARWEPSPPA